ncbi:YbaN family protein [Salipiger abyssi]|uniref:YbaN family protein n=1 Tax=Salipiger abyssi TaxID=1250539 RepID=UPI004059B694
MRFFWIILGSLSLGLGIIGILLPVLPTTPFVLLSAFAYARGSDRMHRALVDSRLFGPMIADWQAEGAISRRAKIMAASMMALVFAVSLALRLPWPALLLQAVCMSLAAAYVLSRPTPVRER